MRICMWGQDIVFGFAWGDQQDPTGMTLEERPGRGEG